MALESSRYDDRRPGPPPVHAKRRPSPPSDSGSRSERHGSEAAVTGYAVEWLDLREDADAAARNAELVDLLLPSLGDASLIIRDLGSGTGSMGRWLAARLSGPQHWILHDRDPALLAEAATR